MTREPGSGQDEPRIRAIMCPVCGKPQYEEDVIGWTLRTVDGLHGSWKMMETVVRCRSCGTKLTADVSNYIEIWESETGETWNGKSADEPDNGRGDAA